MQRESVTKRAGDGDPAAATLDVRGRRGRGLLPRPLPIVLHVAVVAMLLGTMAWVQRTYGLERYGQSSVEWVRRGWLPIAVSLLYGLAWCAWYLMLTARTRDDAKPNADIARQWNAAKRRLERTGIDIHRVPLFLTLGQPSGGVHHFFSSDQFPFSVPAIPVDDDAPLSVCGDSDGVFVCCNQTSLLGDFISRFAASDAAPQQASTSIHRSPLAGRDAPPADDRRGSPRAAAHIPAASPPSATGDKAVATLTRTRPAVAAVPLSATVHDMEQRLADLERQLALADAAPEAEEGRNAIPSSKEEVSAVSEPDSLLEKSLQLDSSTAERLIERLELLCRLIAEDREPLCPLNGIVLLVPIQATDSDALVDEVGNRIEQDLQAVMRMMETEVSVQVVMCGLEACEGADQWLARCPQESRHRPLGTTLPDAPTSEPDAEATLIDQTSDWLCNELVPSLAYPLLRRDGSDPLTDREHQEGNRRLYRFVQSMRDRRDRLSRMLHRSTALAAGRWRLRGCFLAATGSDLTTEQGFTAGLMPLIQGMQNEVRWLESRCRRDTVHLAVTIAGYALMALVAVATIALLVV